METAAARPSRRGSRRGGAMSRKRHQRRHRHRQARRRNPKGRQPRCQKRRRGVAVQRLRRLRPWLMPVSYTRLTLPTICSV
eukprot:7145513-Alexandrium_andersonii.AAC.1